MNEETSSHAGNYSLRSASSGESRTRSERGSQRPSTKTYIPREKMTAGYIDWEQYEQNPAPPSRQ